jgi:hypothetical protein
MRIPWRVIHLLAGLGFGLFGYFLCAGIASRVVRDSVAPRPFYLQVRVTNVVSGPSRHVGDYITSVNRARGQFEQYVPDKVRGEGTERMVSFPDGRMIKIADAQRLKTTTLVSSPIRLKGMAQMGLPVGTCYDKNKGGREWLRSEVIVGEKAEVTRAAISPEIRITEWNVPSLGCARVKYIIERSTSHGFEVATLADPVVFKIGEPPRELFDIAADYKELAPSLFDSQMKLARGIDSREMSSREAASWKAKDEAYYAGMKVLRGE